MLRTFQLVCIPVRKIMKIRAGAVPEHFFYPWKVWLKENKNWSWEEFPGGSGAMLKELEKGSLDVAFLLTESAVAAKAKGADIEILRVYVESSLPWGIFTGAKNPIKETGEGRIYAISRFGSGSHLMAILEASFRAQEIQAHQWLEVGDLNGAREALLSGKADLFFWEKWTSKPLVDTGDFKMLDVFPGPWPAFVMCGRTAFLAKENVKEELLQDFQQVCDVAKEMKLNLEKTAIEISGNYGIQLKDAIEWLQYVVWSDGKDDGDMAKNIALEGLSKAGIIQK